MGLGLSRLKGQQQSQATTEQGNSNLSRRSTVADIPTNRSAQPDQDKNASSLEKTISDPDLGQMKRRSSKSKKDTTPEKKQKGSITSSATTRSRSNSTSTTTSRKGSSSSNSRRGSRSGSSKASSASSSTSTSPTKKATRSSARLKHKKAMQDEENVAQKEQQATKKEEKEEKEEEEEEEDDGLGLFGDEEDSSEESDGETSHASAFTPVKYSKEATERLLEDLKQLRKPESKECGFSVTPVEDNIYKWHVKLFGWDDETQIKQDMFLYESVTSRDHVLLEVLFPGEYPNLPPFIRVVYPRFHQYTGHITIGGSICIKDLTKSGWSKEYELQTFFVMIRNLLLEGGALIDMDNALNDYTEAEAKEAFDRVARAHGWEP